MAVAGYNIYLGGVKQNTSLVTDLSYALSGLSAETAYNVTISAVDTAGNESAQSAAVNFSTIVASGGGGSYDTTYQAKLDYATANSIPHPTAAQSDIYNQRLVDFKAGGGFAKADVVVDWSGTADIRFKMICMKRLIECSVSGAITNNATGLAGAGGYVDLNYIPSNGVQYTFGNAGIFFVANNNPSGTFSTYGVEGANGRYTGLIGNRPSGSNYYALNTTAGSGAANAGKFQKIGANGHYRENSTEVIYKTDVTNTLPIVNNDVRPDASMYVFAENFKGTARNFSTIEIGFFAIGASLSAEHDALKIALE